jgi:hypothetical protein
MSSSTWVRRGAVCALLTVAGAAVSACGVVLPISHPDAPTPGALPSVSRNPSPSVPVTTESMDGPDAVRLGTCVALQAEQSGIEPTSVTVFTAPEHQALDVLMGPYRLQSFSGDGGSTTPPPAPDEARSVYVVWIAGRLASPPPAVATGGPGTSIPAIWFVDPVSATSDDLCQTIGSTGTGAAAGRSLTELGVARTLPADYWRSVMIIRATATPS